MEWLNKKNYWKQRKQMVSFKEGRRQNRMQKKHSTSQKTCEKKAQSLLGQIWYKSKHEIHRTQPKVYKILKSISKDIGNSQNSGTHRWKCISSVLWKIKEHKKT